MPKKDTLTFGEWLHEAVFREPASSTKARKVKRLALMEQRIQNRHNKKIVYLYDMSEHRKFLQDITPSTRLHDLDFLLGAYFGTDAEQKIMGIINFAGREKSAQVSDNELLELFNSYLSAIEDEKRKSAFQLQFFGNAIFYRATYQYMNDASFKKRYVADVISTLRGNTDTMLLTDQSSLEVTQIDVEKIPSVFREEAIYALANIAIFEALNDRSREGLVYMALALSIARFVNFQFKMRDNFEEGYIMFLYRSGMQQVARYIMRTDDYIIVPFETYKADLGTIERVN